MQRKVCRYCGLVNFSDHESCKRCKRNLNSGIQNDNETDLSETSVESLGNLLFQSKTSNMAIIVMVLGIAISIVSLIAISPLKTSMKDEFYIMFLIVVVMPFLCGVGAYYLISKQKVDFYQNGFVYQKKTTIFWREIENCTDSITWFLCGGIPIGRGRALTIKTYHGEEIVLGQELAGLSNKIEFIKRSVIDSNLKRKYQKH